MLLQELPHIPGYSKARAMVVEWGMSDILGPLKYSENEEDVFLGSQLLKGQVCQTKLQN